MKNRRILKYVIGMICFILCFCMIRTDMGEVYASEEVLAGTVKIAGEEGGGTLRTEGNTIVVREAVGDLEAWEALEIPEEILAEWRPEMPGQVMAQSADSEISEFLTYGSDYGYQDMAKRSNAAARQEAYRQLDILFKNFSTSGQNAAIRNYSGKDYAAAGVVDLPYDLSAEELSEIFFTFRNDNPQYFWLPGQVLFSWSSYGGTIVSSSLVVVSYDDYQNGTVRSQTLEEIAETFQNVYQSQIASGDDRYHKVLKIHDALIADIEYSSDTSIPISHSIAGGMTSAKSAVCEGYAKIMQLVMNAHGIENIYVVGVAGGPHAWNMVRMNEGKYYWLDATWDDQTYEAFQHQYFLVGNKKFTDHTPDLSTGVGKNFLYDLPLTSDEDYVYDPSVSDVTKGDINGDGKITMPDLLMCLHHVSGRTVLTGDAFQAADVNGDSKVTMTDLLRILHYVSGRNREL